MANKNLTSIAIKAKSKKDQEKVINKLIELGIGKIHPCFRNKKAFLSCCSPEYSYVVICQGHTMDLFMDLSILNNNYEILTLDDIIQPTLNFEET